MIRKYLALLSALSMALLLVALGMPSAKATSAYDSAYQTVSSLQVGSNNSAVFGRDEDCPYVDMSTDWSSYITNPVTVAGATNYPDTLPSTYVQSFETALASGAWTVSLKDYGTYIQTVQVMWTEDKSLSLNWTTLWGVPRAVATGNNLHFVEIGYYYAQWGGSSPESCTNDGLGVYMYMDTPSDIQSYTGATVSSSDGEFKNFVFTGDPNYPSGYDGASVIQAYVPPASTYVAMGDSFSSGEGNPPFEAGSDTSSDSCHRSPQAYPRLLEFDTTLDLGPTAFVACSGATTQNVLYGGSGDGAYGETPQIDALSNETKLVTITIGGNDIKFKDFAHACATANCASTSSEYQESWAIMTDSTRSDYLPNRLEAVFSTIATKLTAANTSAKVYVVGYPFVVTHDRWVNTTSSNPNDCLYLSEASSSGAESIVDKLDDVIDQAVTDFGDSRFAFVDPRSSNSPFTEAHQLCGDGSYFNGVDIINQEYTFHPNSDGHLAYASLVTSYMS